MKSPYIYSRQRRLLGLVGALDGMVENLDFQKLLFLHCKEIESLGEAGQAADLYEFVPYRYGAFSFTCYSDRRRLVDRGLLANDDQHWVLTETGETIAHEACDVEMRRFAIRHRGLRGDALIAETYRRYPYFAIRSEIAERVLQNDQGALRKIAAACPPRRSARILTIGYERRTLESYLSKLIQSSVTILCDVRRNAISRKYGFSKTTLANACDGVGIRYEHFPELGIESQRRQGLKTQADVDGLFRCYRRDTLPMQGHALNRIHSWLRSGQSVALTCYEREASQCHRHCVADALGRRSDPTNVSQQPVGTLDSEETYIVRHL